ncbi:uncharacterized protein LOC111603321 [Drosophila hydei]|uniref:Uncharacterized protein LOC111603321 n=1 Tax=Drosophila hydei TaxID=7224 RepID=A0A6J1M8P5_DROHY|nr:uncharacterized protein LOC111603321 [Drosophila hydei]
MSIASSFMPEECSAVGTFTTIGSIESTCQVNANKSKRINGMSKSQKHKRNQTKKRTNISKTTTTTTTTTQTIAEETGCLMDVLHLRMLELIEDRISLQLQLEKQTAEARLMLAKCRMQQGRPHFAAVMRFSSSTPYRALYRLLEQSLEWWSCLKLLRHDVDQEMDFLRPINRIVGALVPYSLRLTNCEWERCVEKIMENANIQRELQSVIKSIERLNWALRRRGYI